ncbi:MAG: putative Nucleotidyltransferase [Promethearchaeota archaeon]|nr:MAG: putative Nucleotidyltransferase [Candidatus Lokiarchaeota archaeon]
MYKKKLNKITELLKNHLKRDKLIEFLKKFYSKYQAEFIILFGSSAKGYFNYRSDIDLLIVSDSIEGDYFEKLRKMYDISSDGIDFFVYNIDKFDEMVKEFHPITLEALYNGILLYDKGMGKKYKKRVKKLLENDTIRRSKNSWTINN